MSPKKARGVAALDEFDQRHVLGLDALGNRLIGGESIAELAPDVREIHARHNQCAALLVRERLAHRLDE